MIRLNHRRPFNYSKKKKPAHRVEMTDGKRNIIRQLLQEYDVESAEYFQDA